MSRDITERKLAEKELSDNETQLDTLLQTIPDLIWLKDVNGVYLTCNKMFERLYGAKKSDIVGKTDFDFVKSELAVLFREHDRKAMEAGIPTNNEEWLTFADDGHRIFSDTIKTPMYDAQGNLIGVLGIGRDITERKLAENKLLESETRLKQISEGTEEWIWEVDTNGVFTYVNPYAKKLLGYAPEELIGIKHFYDYFEPEHKEELIQGALIAFERKESIRNFINCNIHKDGKRIILSTSGFPIIDSENNFIGYRGINVDITNKQKAEDKLKRSEERLKEAQQLGHIGNWELDVVKNTGTMSDEMYKIVNIDRNSVNITIETFLETPIPEDRKMVRELVMKSQEAHEGIEFDFRTITPNGEIRWIHERSTVELDNKGNPKRIFGTCQDITESKLLQLKLEDSERKTRSLLHAIPDMIFRMDREGTYLDFKADKSDLYAQSEQTIIGKKNRDITLPEFANLVDRYIRLTLDSGEMQEFEYQMITPKRGLRDYEARMLISGKDEIIAVVRDITERKHADESIKLFRTLLDKSNDVIEIVDAETGQFIDVNERACTELGYSRSELLSMKVFDINPNQTPEEFQSIMVRSQLSDSTIIETLHQRKDGSTFPVEVNVTIVKLEKTYTIGVVRDITQRKKMEANLSTAAELAKLGYWEFDVKSGNFTFDDQYYRLIHGSSTEIQGGNIMRAEEFVRRLVHPDDSKTIGYKLTGSNHLN